MADSDAGKLKLKTLDHIGIQVRDVEEVIETWERTFGIGPWTIREMTHTTPEGETLTTKLAFAYTDNGVEIELIQSIRNDFIDTHGEGLHHLGFFVNDVDEDAAKAVEQGAKVAFKGPGGNIHLDADGPGGVRFELMRRRGRVADQ
ncbi:MAG: VOC family protein [Desulfobacterales bacterium]